jgi:choline-glycine betaine transporter
MAAPFAIVMVLLCVALAKDLRSGPLVQRDNRSKEKVENAVTYGHRKYGDDFHLRVEPRDKGT